LREGKQLGAERTFSHDIRDRAAIRAEILKLADQVSYRLRSEGIFARRVSLKIRRADFTTYSRSKTFTRATHARQAFAEQALELWSAFDQEQPHALIRLIGVAGGQLEESVQADFFSNHTTDQKATTFSVKNTHPAAAAGELSHTLDRIQERFGQDALRRGSGFKRTT
jgi:DNA polymerase-4